MSGTGGRATAACGARSGWRAAACSWRARRCSSWTRWGVGWGRLEGLGWCGYARWWGRVCTLLANLLRVTGEVQAGEVQARQTCWQVAVVSARPAGGVRLPAASAAACSALLRCASPASRCLAWLPWSQVDDSRQTLAYAARELLADIAAEEAALAAAGALPELHCFAWHAVLRCAAAPAGCRALRCCSAIGLAAPRGGAIRGPACCWRPDG